ncbi:MAG: hypothetical protein JXB10_19695 [Pirellulales bacterium]|nr:hypothetical protein [Pirellulales bacterium]
MRYRRWFVLLVYGILLTVPPASARAEGPQAVRCAPDASYAERLAAREVRRYFYLRTGRLLPITTEAKSPSSGEMFVVGAKQRACVLSLLADADPAVKKAVEGLQPEQYLVKTLVVDGRPAVLVAGGDPIGALYGAYRLAEALGMRFYLHGDVAPDERLPDELPQVDLRGKPLFALRGIQPFHDFPEGPDWWNTDDYKAYLTQLPKMGMNFFGLHCYPENNVGPEPLVWIDPADEIGRGARVKASYPARHFTTDSQPPAWGYSPLPTASFSFGAADLFDRDDYGADYMRGTHPWKEMSPEQCNALFTRVGSMLSDTFRYAKRLGIKTCIGTETPLTIPTPVKKRLEALGKNPADPAVVQEVYEGMFRRIKQTHPLDYYWFWTPESWTWEKVEQKQIDATLADLRAALAAAEKVKAPFTLATCGWVLGPPQSPALFDEFLPKDMPMSCINRTVGNTPVEPGFARVHGRPKWAIPWMEDDPGMTMPQLWAGRMRRDAADALAYGCTGLMGIHWRTEIIGPNVSALAKAAWDQSWNVPSGKDSQNSPAKEKPRFLPAGDFYADWAVANFGPHAAVEIAAIFSRLDGRLPRPADWVTGPGSIRPDDRPWETVIKDYLFVDELEAAGDKVEGPGNRQRYEYWLDVMRLLRSIAHVRCDWGLYHAAIEQVEAEKDPEIQKKLARESALPLRIALVGTFAEMHRHLLNSIHTPGEMGNVANWQTQTLPVVLTKPGEELEKLLGGPLPPEAQPLKTYTGRPRLFVPTVRTVLQAGEPLKLTVIILGGAPRDAALYWRPLGTGEFTKIPLAHVARAVYTVTLPPEAVRNDLEYYLRATVGDQPVFYPAAAPAASQTVVVVDGRPPK